MDHDHHGHHSHQSATNRPHKMIDQQGHDEHAGHHTENFLKRFWICLVITIPVLLLSHMIQQWLGFELTFTGDSYILLALSSVIYFYGGWPRTIVVAINAKLLKVNS